MASTHENNKLLEALLPDEDEDLPQIEVKCEVRDSDAARFDWRVYYAVGLANMIEIHLETLEKRRIQLVK